MYVRDHARVEFHQALNVSPTDYDREVLKVTSEISKQIFPFTINLDDARVWAYFDKLRVISERMDELKTQNNLLSKFKRLGCGVQAGLTFIKLYFVPVVPNQLPSNVRLQPVW